MKTSPAIYFLLLLLMASVACEKTDPVLLSGDIEGLVSVYDENFYLQEDMSGVLVSLTNETFAGQTSTDPSGRFLFEDIFYGNYQVDWELEGYFTMFKAYPLHHLGGYSPTMVEYRIDEIPKFETHIDSIKFNGPYERSYIYVNFQGLSGLPKFGYNFWCFFSDTPDVSKDQFAADDVGWIWSPEIYGQLSEISIEIYDNWFDQLETGTIYCCVYPRAEGQSYYDYYPESLGKASNVISFELE